VASASTRRARSRSTCRNRCSAPSTGRRERGPTLRSQESRSDRSPVHRVPSRNRHRPVAADRDRPAVISELDVVGRGPISGPGNRGDEGIERVGVDRSLQWGQVAGFGAADGSDGLDDGRTGTDEPFWEVVPRLAYASTGRRRPRRDGCEPRPRRGRWPGVRRLRYRYCRRSGPGCGRTWARVGGPGP
jgi:hypothetical protein